MEDASGDAGGSGRRTRTRGVEAVVRSAALDRLRAIKEGRARASEAVQLKVDAPIYDTVAEEDYAALVARRRKEAGEFIIDDDGLGYAEDGREEDWTHRALPSSNEGSDGEDGSRRKRKQPRPPQAKRPQKSAAMVNCKEKSKVVERTQATIVAATIEGIPSNIDLFKELMLPFVIMAENFKKLQRWENPRSTICFLLLVHTVVFRNMLSYVFPFTLMMMALSMLAVKGLKEQGRLGRSFAKVTIRDQPPSNTIQKILALKEAMASVENYLQNLNVSLLKIRTIFLAGQPEVTTQVALVLLASSAVLLVFPFKYVLAFFMFDLFTRELEFRREMVRAFMDFGRERWDSIHAAPVVVLPYEGAESSPKTLPAKASGQSEPRWQLCHFRE